MGLASTQWEVSGNFSSFQGGTIPNGMASNLRSIEYAEHGLAGMDSGGHVSKDLWSMILDEICILQYMTIIYR